MKPQRFFYKSLASAVMVGLVSLNAHAFGVTGKYCDTPSRCVNPATTQGMITTPNYLATQAGVQVLREGGNTIDAAIAALATLSVVYPHFTTIGGDSFWLIYNAKTKEVRAIDASGRSGQNATIEFYKSKGYSEIPPRGYLAVNTVPGIVSGWDTAYRYGNTTMGHGMPWPSLLQSAIDICNSMAAC